MPKKEVKIYNEMFVCHPICDQSIDVTIFFQRNDF